MDNLNIYFSSLHHIDISENKVIIPSKEPNEKDYKEYFTDLLKDILIEKVTRNFKASSDSTEIIAIIKESINDLINYDKYVSKIANRLLLKETIAQDRHKQITEIQRGSLIQSYFQYKGDKYYVLVKIEHGAFIDESDLKKHIGLPFKKKLLKICLLKINNNIEIEEIIVSDSNPSISQYWWQDFLELIRLKTDDDNTEDSFSHISNLINRRIKEKSPRDHTLIRNNLIGYFKTHNNFNINDLCSNVFGEYIPFDSSLDIEKIKNEVADLPEKKKFDSQFGIISSKITSRKLSSVYTIKNNIELNVKDYDPDLENDIWAEKTKDGKKYIKILTDNDETFRIFFKKNTR